ncbi:putative gibberellin regulated protein [Medicago truncatula]|uniref:Gibberellin regulated protein n=1 Tax=Medicago truncatula TaxID=3880 RepID=Q2HRJ5_MEDTR|nr:peamaclein [Medicago truncatula]ABD33278.1 Gibberellin regulated protein [Medicago truncatula]ACJ86188.1 unknown [Medicago truncatula]AES59365.1 gibberellin-regulated family protein [Medicago truncatula]AFK38793.1 unknown [Medicago truncatula]RHN77258.1 putative gibberellin regulated protein [Medicago truncatula]|mmetsp:Transcript_30808/g.62120  ORF Transcript_30808/g.62120 Transcript_30808/m.62120 type:complete len:92 (-) Transcript_30808:58-333(-)
MKPAFAAMLLVCLILSSFMFEMSIAGTDSGRFCSSKCGQRCSKAGMKDRCMKFCGICCGKCKCVPSGTYGNKHECPCYRDMKNSKGKPKCP